MVSSQLGGLDPLFANHLAFLGTHRGTVTIGDEFARVVGFEPFLSSWTPLRAAVAVPADDTVRLIPQSGDGWPDQLEGAGYKPAEALNYMELETGSDLASANADCRIYAVTNDADADDFAAVQTAAFLDKAAAEYAWWVDCFRRMARANYRRDDQRFLIASVHGAAAAVLLAIEAAGVTGIYAVATDPAYQRRGLSTRLLREAQLIARKRGFNRLILQALVGSYAEGFYQRLGFASRYVSQVWRREQ